MLMRNGSANGLADHGLCPIGKLSMGFGALWDTPNGLTNYGPPFVDFEADVHWDCIKRLHWEELFAPNC